MDDKPEDPRQAKSSEARHGVESEEKEDNSTPEAPVGGTTERGEWTTSRKPHAGEKGEKMRIEYEDQEILVIYKEAGLPVQTARTSQKDVVSLLKKHLARTEKAGTAGTVTGEKTADRRGQGAEPYLGIIHRLDQPVEGLLVFAKTPKAAAVLSAQVAAKDGMEKIYQAAVCLDASSYPLAVQGMKREETLVDWLGRDRSSNMAYIASEDEKGAKRAELTFRTLRIQGDHALLEICLHTGRHHQIRIQMAYAGMPLLGDRKYRPVHQAQAQDKGAASVQAQGNTDLRLQGQDNTAPSSQTQNYTAEGRISQHLPLCLCACRLSLIHPRTKEEMQFAVEPSWLSAL